MIIGKVIYEEFFDEVIRKFIGGKGFGYYIIYREVLFGIDLFSLVNKFVFVVGGLIGFVLGLSKVIVISKSFEMRFISDLSGGDVFGLKFRGYFDVLIIEGKSEEFVYFYIYDGKVEIKDVSYFWGKGNYEVVKEFWKEYLMVSMVMVGLVGERFSRIVDIIYDIERVSGRGGFGVVFGSKRVKVVVVEFGEKFKVVELEEF